MLLMKVFLPLSRVSGVAARSGWRFTRCRILHVRRNLPSSLSLSVLTAHCRISVRSVLRYLRPALFDRACPGEKPQNKQQKRSRKRGQPAKEFHPRLVTWRQEMFSRNHVGAQFGPAGIPTSSIHFHRPRQQDQAARHPRHDLGLVGGLRRQARCVHGRV